MSSRSYRLFVLVMLAVVLLTACGSAPAGSQVVRIGTQPWIGYGP